MKILKTFGLTILSVVSIVVIFLFEINSWLVVALQV